jgi:hypothetical protein
MSNDTTDDLDIDVLAADPEPWAVGDIITCVVGGATANFSIPGFGGETYRRGDRITVTSDTLEHQAKLLALVEDADEQVRRWGQQKFARGPLELERWLTKGDAEWIIAKDAARAIANQIIDPAERARELTEINARFGRVPTSTSTDNRAATSYLARKTAQEDFERQQLGRHIVHSTAV